MVDSIDYPDHFIVGRRDCGAAGVKIDLAIVHEANSYSLLGDHLTVVS